jgi:lipopolysaccharide export LptBFGC system permease protein LptF
MRLCLLFTLALLLHASLFVQAQQMNNQKLEEIIKKESPLVEGQEGAWQVLFGERILLIITDQQNNRMRIFTPIIEEEQIEEAELKNMLIANFHSALDAKYSLYDGFVVSVFTHPLKELTSNQLVDAMKQVASLANTFGTTYTSSELFFGGGIPEKEEKRINESPSKKSKKT